MAHDPGDENPLYALARNIRADTEDPVREDVSHVKTMLVRAAAPGESLGQAIKATKMMSRDYQAPVLMFCANMYTPVHFSDDTKILIRYHINQCRGFLDPRGDALAMS